MKRIAICIYGHARSMSTSRLIENMRRSTKFSFDVYVHCWDTSDLNRDTLAAYNPVSIMIENKKHFDVNPFVVDLGRHHNWCYLNLQVSRLLDYISQMYSRNKVANLIEESGKEYHLVMFVRHDINNLLSICDKVDEVLQEMSDDKLYASVGNTNFNDNCIIGHPETMIRMNQIYSNWHLITPKTISIAVPPVYEALCPESLLLIGFHTLRMQPPISFEYSKYLYDERSKPNPILPGRTDFLMEKYKYMLQFTNEAVPLPQSYKFEH